MTFNPKEHITTILEYSNSNKLEIKEFGRFKTINYSREVQYSQEWDFITLNCRGLIVDEEWNVVGRSFPKFFNHNEKENENLDIDKLSDITIQEKLDGSLGIMFWDNIDNIWRISTKGSLESDQSKWAMNWYNSNKELFSEFNNKEYSYLFEIIYNENKIVCSYEQEGLYFLTAIRNIDGSENINTENTPYPLKPKVYTLEQFNSMFYNQEDVDGLFEGFVIRYSDNDGANYKRVKLKYDLYVKLHKLLWGITYEKLYDNIISVTSNSFSNDLLEFLPDEAFEDYKKAELRILEHIKETDVHIHNYIDSLYRTINYYFDNIYNESSEYYSANDNKLLYKINKSTDQFGKLVDWYFKYFGFYNTEKSDYLPFLFKKYGNGNNPKSETIYNIYYPDFGKESIF